jgi:hypothetical protein
VSDDAITPHLTKRTLAAWRSELANLRVAERQRSANLSVETGRLLEVVGQALAQGGGPLPPDDVARIEELTRINAAYTEPDDLARA